MDVVSKINRTCRTMSDGRNVRVLLEFSSMSKYKRRRSMSN